MKIVHSLTGQRGVAVVVAMGVVSLAAMAATAILISQSTWSRQNELVANHVQAKLLVQAGADWARAVLLEDRRTSSVDHLGEPWALKLPALPIENGRLAGYLEDQQGRFNLNNIVNAGKVNVTQLAYFRRMLSILSLPDTLADALADWIDSDNVIQSTSGAEDDYYLALPSPYLTANRPLVDIAELALVRGFDENVRTRLRPFVTALPRPTAVNVNTAPAEVLATIIEDMSLDEARAIVTNRGKIYFLHTADFANRLNGTYTIPHRDMTVTSHYFMATLSVNIGLTEARGMVLLAREDTGWPIVVWQKYL